MIMKTICVCVANLVLAAVAPCQATVLKNTGCAAVKQTTRIVGEPRIGSTIALYNDLACKGVGLLVMGLDIKTPLLWVEPGNQLCVVLPDRNIVHVEKSGVVAVALPIPRLPRLIGLSLYVQGGCVIKKRVIMDDTLWIRVMK